MKLPYSIYSGAGNDFVMINNINGFIPFEQQKNLTIKICTEQFENIDGIIFLEKPIDSKNSIRMNYYNRDGSFGAMCGNGARCISQFAIDENILHEQSFMLEALDKVYRAEIKDNNLIKIYFPPPDKYDLNLKISKVNGLNTITGNYMMVGSDHLVIFIKDEMNKEIFSASSLDDVSIELWGSVLRYHPDFQPEGANVNFVDVFPPNELRVRTYERGVERETLACGTGIISSAVISSLLNKVNSPVKVLVQSKEWLTVDFNIKNNSIENLSLDGPAKKIKEGEMDI